LIIAFFKHKKSVKTFFSNLDPHHKKYQNPLKNPKKLLKPQKITSKHLHSPSHLNSKASQYSNNFFLSKTFDGQNLFNFRGGDFISKRAQIRLDLGIPCAKNLDNRGRLFTILVDKSRVELGVKPTFVVLIDVIQNPTNLAVVYFPSKKKKNLIVTACRLSLKSF
jgi:hypothetical protein